MGQTGEQRLGTPELSYLISANRKLAIFNCQFATWVSYAAVRLLLGLSVTI